MVKSKNNKKESISGFVDCTTCTYYEYLGYHNGEKETICRLDRYKEHNAGKSNGGWTKCDFYYEKKNNENGGIEMEGDICIHCRHYKKKRLHGRIVSERCANRHMGNNVHFRKCSGFSRSIKSRLGLVTQVNEE